jgi:hypothetical protein
MRLKQTWRRRFTIIGVGMLIGVCGFLYHRYGPRQTPPGQPLFVRLTSANFPILIDRFNSGDGTLRVLVMLSPT